MFDAHYTRQILKGVLAVLNQSGGQAASLREKVMQKEAT